MLWFRKIPNHIPFAKGPFVPGCSDIMTGYSANGLFLRLYYPTDYKDNASKHVSHWIPWLADESYLKGFAKVLMLWLFIVRLVIWLMSGKLYIPAIYGGKVKSNDTLKCIILSHGLGGHRFLYTSTCIELASRGFLIIALEHRDESPCRTYYYKNKTDVENDRKTFIEHVTVKLGNDHYATRNIQVRQRAEECKKVYELINNIQKGEIPYDILQDLKTNRIVQFKLEDLIGRIDINDITMMGHSFGGATSIVTLAAEKKIKQGVLLDTWMFPIKNMPELITDVKQPLLFINTQTFHIASNVKAMQSFVDLNKEARPMYTILHTTHESQSDSVFVAGYWFNWFMKKLDPKTAIRINNALILRYLKDHTGIPTDITDTEEYLLQEANNFTVGITKPWA